MEAIKQLLMLMHFNSTMKLRSDTGIKTINFRRSNATGANTVGITYYGNFTITGSAGVEQITGGLEPM